MVRGTGKKCLVTLYFGSESSSYANMNITGLVFLDDQIESE